MVDGEKADSAENPYAPPESYDGKATPLFDYRVVVFWGCSALLVFTAWSVAGLTLATFAATCALIVFWAAWRGKGYPPSTLVECWVCIAILWILWGLLTPAVQTRGRRRRVAPPTVQEAGTQEQAEKLEPATSDATNSSSGPSD